MRKKLLPILLSMTLLFSFSNTVYAEENENVGETIKCEESLEEAPAEIEEPEEDSEDDSDEETDKEVTDEEETDEEETDEEESTEPEACQVHIKVEKEEYELINLCPSDNIVLSTNEAISTVEKGEYFKHFFSGTLINNSLLEKINLPEKIQEDYEINIYIDIDGNITSEIITN